MTKLRRNTAALALLCVGTIAAVCGVRAGLAGASDGPAVGPQPVAVPADSVNCPPGKPGLNDPDVQAAVGEMDAWGADAGSKSYLGSFPCPTTKTVMVYRLSGHPDLDRQAVSVGAHHHVSIALVNSDYAYAPLRAAVDRIRADQAELAAQGVQIQYESISRGGAGSVQVAVLGNADSARAALAKYGPFIQVITS